MLGSFEAGLTAWLWPGFSAVLAVLATYVVYRLATYVDASRPLIGSPT